jgi:hypothetical protein
MELCVLSTLYICVYFVRNYVKLQNPYANSYVRKRPDLLMITASLTKPKQIDLQTKKESVLAEFLSVAYFTIFMLHFLKCHNANTLANTEITASVCTWEHICLTE